MKETSEQLQSSESFEQKSYLTKLLNQISPVPRIEERCRRRKKTELAKVITFQKHIQEKELKSAVNFSKMDTPI